MNINIYLSDTNSTYIIFYNIGKSRAYEILTHRKMSVQ